MSSKEYQERTRHFRQIAHAKAAQNKKPAPTSKKHPILDKLSKAMADLRAPKLFPSLSNLPPLPFNTSFLDFLIGKNSSLLSFSIVLPFLHKLKRQSNSNTPSSQSKLHFEGKEMSHEKGIQSFYKRDSNTCNESLEFMHRLMDHFTHLANFETPVDPELAIFIAARLVLF